MDWSDLDALDIVTAALALYATWVARSTRREFGRGIWVQLLQREGDAHLTLCITNTTQAELWVTDWMVGRSLRAVWWRLWSIWTFGLFMPRLEESDRRMSPSTRVEPFKLAPNEPRFIPLSEHLSGRVTATVETSRGNLVLSRTVRAPERRRS